jgi:predicted phosphoadenosine phosphosulfate sulfurtransferase
MEKKILEYIRKWEKQGYESGIPDEVPMELMKQNLAPSYKAIVIAILKNDHNMKTLGFDTRKSEWYDAYKKIEIAARPENKNKDSQMEFNFFQKN